MQIAYYRSTLRSLLNLPLPRSLRVTTVVPEKATMRSSPLPLLLSLLLLLLLRLSTTTSLSSPDEFTVDSHPAKLLLTLGRLVDPSPGSRPLACARVHIRGLSRLRNPSRFAHALRVSVDVPQSDGLFRVQSVELCFHRNASIGIGMCPASQWQKLSKSSWVQSMSPYGYRILDVRMPPDPSRTIEVSTAEEFMPFRVVFLVVGMVMIATAHSLSESVVFYYGGAMTIGIILVILMILFQGMRLLPTGRKSSLAIFMYSSAVGVTTFLLSYLSWFWRSILVGIGISEDMHYPVFGYNNSRMHRLSWSLVWFLGCSEACSNGGRIS